MKAFSFPKNMALFSAARPGEVVEFEVGGEASTSIEAHFTDMVTACSRTVRAKLERRMCQDFRRPGCDENYEATQRGLPDCAHDMR